MAARILIAEDHPPSLELMRYLLQSSGYETLTAIDGREAVAVARREHPDLVVCDLQMPEMDGFAVARALKADPALAALPLVAVTAFSMVGDREKVLAAGFEGYYPKPIEPERFVAQMEQHLRPARRVPR